MVAAQGCGLCRELPRREPGRLRPGIVMSIGKGGQLRISCEAYDRKVAGIITAAGESGRGIVRGRRPGASDAPLVPVALTGRVLCLVETEYEPSESGDLLTSSRRRAMRQGL